MEIKEIGPEHKLEFNLVVNHPLQSWEWGDFRVTAGNRVIRIGIFENTKLIKGFQVILSKIPHTPFSVGTIIKGEKPTPQLLEYLKSLGRKEKAIFFKLEPNQVNDPQVKQILKKGGCLPGKRFFTPTTFWIDLTKKEEDLLAGFTPKTRYNIRLASKKGVTVQENNSPKAFDKYLLLTKETTQRQHFYAHSEKYHQLMWNTLNPTGIAHLLTAMYKGEIVTTWILFVWKKFLYYPYGASTEKFKNIMANNLVMWEAIKFGKKLGLTTFDLWGREEGKGFTKFKEGYNPKVVEFCGSWDLPTNFLYPLYRLLEKIRWVILKLKTKVARPSF